MNLKAVVAASLAAPVAAMAEVAPLVLTDQTEYLESYAGGGMLLIGGVVLTLSALGVAIKWVKATFFG